MAFRIHALVLGALALLMQAPAAHAQNVLFSGSLERLGAFGAGVFATVPVHVDGKNVQGAISVALTTAPTRPGFTVPQAAFSAVFSYTASFGNYPFFANYASRQNLKWSVMNGGFSGTSTVYPSTNNDIYPMSALASRSGFLRAKAGPNNIGGAMPSRRASNFVGIVAATTGFYDFYNEFSSTGCSANGSVGSPLIPGGNCIVYGNSRGEQLLDSFSTLIHQTLNRTLGQVWGVTGGIGITGNITVSNPIGGLSLVMASAMDDRNAAGTMGTIQLIHPRVVYGYQMPTGTGGGTGVPPRDGTATFVNLNGGLAGAVRANLTFLPEPGQGMLLAAGILGIATLAAAATARRRSRTK